MKSLNPRALCHGVFIHLIARAFWIWLCSSFLFFLSFLPPSLPSSYTSLPTYCAPDSWQAHFPPAVPGGLRGLGVGRAAQHPRASLCLPRPPWCRGWISVPWTWILLGEVTAPRGQLCPGSPCQVGGGDGSAQDSRLREAVLLPLTGLFTRPVPCLSQGVES